MIDRLFMRYGQVGMLSAMALTAPLAYIYAVWLVMTDRWWLIAPAMTLFSLPVMAVLRHLFEGGLKKSFFDPRIMSRSFVWGDSIFLSGALLYAASGWRNLSETWHLSFEYMGLSFAAGVMVAVVFRFVDGSRYRRAGIESALHSPTKAWHDYVVLPVVVALIAWLIAPQISAPSVEFGIAATFLLLFTACVCIDLKWEPDPSKQHLEWDARLFQPA